MSQEGQWRHIFFKLLFFPFLWHCDASCFPNKKKKQNWSNLRLRFVSTLWAKLAGGKTLSRHSHCDNRVKSMRLFALCTLSKAGDSENNCDLKSSRASTQAFLQVFKCMTTAKVARQLSVSEQGTRALGLTIQFYFPGIFAARSTVWRGSSKAGLFFKRGSQKPGCSDFKSQKKQWRGCQPYKITKLCEQTKRSLSG